MTLIIEVSPEAEALARAEAALQGRTVSELLGEIVETRFSASSLGLFQDAENEGVSRQKTLAETLAGRTGRVHSGGSSHGRNSERVFSRLMDAKQKSKQT